jgi:hypothetical protein
MDRRRYDSDGLHILKVLFLGDTPLMLVTDSYEMVAHPMMEGCL